MMRFSILDIQFRVIAFQKVISTAFRLTLGSAVLGHESVIHPALVVGNT